MTPRVDRWRDGALDFIRAPFSRYGAVVLLVRLLHLTVLLCCVVGVVWLMLRIGPTLLLGVMCAALLAAVAWRPARSTALVLCLVVLVTQAGPVWGLLLVPFLCGGSGGTTTIKPS